MTMTDAEYELKCESQRALVGAYGASLRRYWCETAGGGAWEVLWGYEGRAAKVAGQGDVLMPFPSRLKHGRYTFGGHAHQLELTDKEGPNAIHGFLRAELWQAAEVTASRARFTTTIRPDRYAGYPFALALSVEYALSATGLATSFHVRNVGDGAAPFGAGFHPYFRLDDNAIDDWVLSVPADAYLEFADMVPTGRVLPVEGTPLDYRRPRPIGATRFGHCLQSLTRGPDGYASATLARADGARRITLRFDQTFNYLVVYSGEAVPAPHTRRALAIEPLTCATDAFNHPEWGLKVLNPGEDFYGRYEIGAVIVSDEGPC